MIAVLATACVGQPESRSRWQHGAATVTIELLDGRRVQLRIADDGRRQPSERDAVDDVALDVLRERAEALGGTFSIEAAPGAGTVLEVTLP